MAKGKVAIQARACEKLADLLLATPSSSFESIAETSKINNRAEIQNSLKKIKSIQLNASKANGVWWTSFTDSQASVEKRVRQMLLWIKNSSSNSVTSFAGCRRRQKRDPIL